MIDNFSSELLCVNFKLIRLEESKVCVFNLISPAPTLPCLILVLGCVCVRAFSISDKTSDILPSLNLRLLKSRRLVTLRWPGVITRLMLWVPVVAVSLCLWCTFYHSKFLEMFLNNVQVGPSKRNQWPGSLDKEGHWHDNVGSDISRHIIAVSWLWLRDQESGTWYRQSGEQPRLGVCPDLETQTLWIRNESISIRSL